jgi:prepilin-type N-terminal cleavage/methylation domain-containing protein
MRTHLSLRQKRGFTLIEVLVTLAIVIAVIAMAAPSFQNLIAMQRLRSITAQLVTDLQFARNEAVARNHMVKLSFQANSASAMTCYVVYTSEATSINSRCNCELPPGTACPSESLEIKTVQIPSSLKVRVEIPNRKPDTAFAFDNVTGGLYVIPVDKFPRRWAGLQIDSYLDITRKLTVKINGAGRPQVCTPALSTMSETPCTP